ncbi:hypothetical protein HYALB_00008052 [Hymenoscyphus albidus]|uniref:Uncharacterized protein n=1 Tax=Hymenoscyphus albidus TaxID=595503 RepID=A0A9N9LPY6_9HELO|nr:hypothetical protein HYALB_00008052 [Hymenoscyphus albidus]
MSDREIYKEAMVHAAGNVDTIFVTDLVSDKWRSLCDGDDAEERVAELFAKIESGQGIADDEVIHFKFKETDIETLKQRAESAAEYGEDHEETLLLQDNSDTYYTVLFKWKTS